MNETSTTKTEKLKLPLTHSTALKVLAFVMAIVLLAVLAGSILGAALMWEYGVYDNVSKEEMRVDLGWGIAWNDSQNIGWHVGRNDFEYLDEHILRGSNIEAAEIVCSGAQKWTWTYGAWEEGAEASYEMNWNYTVTESGYAIPGYNSPGENVMFIRLRIAEVPTQYDEYWLCYWLTEIAYAMKYAVYLLILLSFVAFLLCVAYLLNAAGHRRGKEGVTPTWTTAIPFDLLTAGGIFLGVMSIYLCDGIAYSVNDVAAVICICLAILFDVVMALAWLMSAALRIKLRTVFTNTVIFMLLRLCWRALRWFWRLFCRFCGSIRRFGERLALFWKAVIVFGAISLVEFIVIMATEWALGMEVFLWVIGRLVLLAALVYICHVLKELYNCGKAVAAGDLSYEVDTRLMPSQFREHAENMRSLSKAVNSAVEQRMVSERMKTELITNVSHDLKTPLTSLINYSDLICREGCDNPRHTEYAEVLHRQSQRLRRLIDDLVEASKASTGNLEVNLAPCEAGVLLMQVAGEYEQRLSEKGLALVAGQPVHRLMIMADGRRLWRVMDNLMNNICKYALSGTRVYLTLEDINGEAVISFKNTSRDPLNLSPEELMERFVRGDSSRGGEGSGLGLSIARSLTELQGGKMELYCDGDLFKVVLRFPIIK